jgi:hypothetical protein
MNEQQRQDLQLLIHAMATEGERGATYQLPQSVALRYAELVREEALAPYRQLIKECSSLLNRLEMDDFGRWQLDRNFMNEVEPLRDDLTLLLSEDPLTCPPRHGDCSEGRRCPARGAS